MSHVLIWKVCRVLANETRLQILKRLFEGESLCVTGIAEFEGITTVVASRHLRLLHESSLLSQKTEGKWTFYKVKSDPEFTITQKMYSPLRNQLAGGKGQIPKVIKSVTAFTHPRRIEIVKQLGAEPLAFDELKDRCSISSRAMTRHLNKLISRGFVENDSNMYKLLFGKTELEKVLLDMCLQ